MDTFVQLTVYFEDPFWVGVFERVGNGATSACKVTFGAEPKDYEVYAFVLAHYFELEFSPTVHTELRRRADSPKRRQREAKRQAQGSGVGTKAQQALQMQREQRKTERAQKDRRQRLEEERRRFIQSQQKRKQKHKGR